MAINQDFELAVLGGGISGLSLALEASRAGKRVCLIERNLCGLGTSNNSLRIIHGGLRYLQKLDFPRILASVSDQSYCLKKWPDYIKPLRCVAPLSGRGLKRANLARIASVMYSCFLGALNSPLERPYVDSRQSYSGLEFLTGLAPHGFLIWQDALLLDHVGLVQGMLSEIKKHGGSVFESCSVSEVRDLNSRVEISCITKDSSNISFTSRHAVNCLGAWLGTVSNPLSSKWCIAFNVILKRQFNPELAFGCDGEQGRYFFFVPRGDNTVVGTGYVELKTNLDQACPSSSDIEAFISCAARAAPKLELSVDDVVGIESGILPMKNLDINSQPILVSGNQIAKIGNVVHALSTKYTTFHSQACDVLRLLK